MSYAPTRVKQAGEVRVITFDFTTKLRTGDSVSAGAVIEAAAGIVVGAPSTSGNLVSASVSGGTLGGTYRLSCRVPTTLAETLELDVDIRIADGEN